MAKSFQLLNLRSFYNSPSTIQTTKKKREELPLMSGWGGHSHVYFNRKWSKESNNTKDGKAFRSEVRWVKAPGTWGWVCFLIQKIAGVIIIFHPQGAFNQNINQRSPSGSSVQSLLIKILTALISAPSNLSIENAMGQWTKAENSAMIYSVVHNLVIEFLSSTVFPNESWNKSSLAKSNLHHLTIIIITII